MLEPPYEVEMTFAMPEGESPKWGWPSSDGDLDKLVRATLDGLVKGALLLDDRHVIALAARKRFGGPCAAVRVL